LYVDVQSVKHVDGDCADTPSDRRDRGRGRTRDSATWQPRRRLPVTAAAT